MPLRCKLHNMGKSRSQRRETNGDICVFGADTTLGWRVVRLVSIPFALEKLARGLWREVKDECGNFVGCQVLTRFHTDADLLPADGSPCYITATEARRNAGVNGKSRTLGMTEEMRRTRRAKYDPDKLLAPEDVIEKAIAKVKAFTTWASRIDDGTGAPVYGDRAVRVYPITRRHHNEPAIAVKGTT